MLPDRLLGATGKSCYRAHQNPLPPPLDPPPPDPDELGLDDMLLAAAVDIWPMLCEKVVALNGPLFP
jgi:hypothetical protein